MKRKDIYLLTALVALALSGGISIGIREISQCDKVTFFLITKSEGRRMKKLFYCSTCERKTIHKWKSRYECECVNCKAKCLIDKNYKEYEIKKERYLLTSKCNFCSEYTYVVCRECLKNDKSQMPQM